MAYNVRIQPTALQELESTVKYLLSFGSKTASTFLNEWNKVIKNLRGGTMEYRLSRFEPLAQLGYHTILINSYIVLYFIDGDDIVVAHLFHQSQDYASIVLNGE